MRQQGNKGVQDVIPVLRWGGVLKILSGVEFRRSSSDGAAQEEQTRTESMVKRTTIFLNIRLIVCFLTIVF